MCDFGAELGITDYLHEVELWRQRLKIWELTLPWPEGAGAALSVESLLELSDHTVYLCRCIRQRLGMDEGLAEPLDGFTSLDELETTLGLSIWKILREEERLLDTVPEGAFPPPVGLPRARLQLAMEPKSNLPSA